MCGNCKELLSYLLQPWKIAIVICVAVWNLFSISFTHSWLEEDLLEGISFKRFSVYIHLLSVLIVAVVLSFHALLVFKLNNFTHCLFTLSFCIYIITELIIMVNALTMQIATSYKYYVESVFLFGILFLYTYIVSWEYQNHLETLRLMHERAIESRISSVFKSVGKGSCFRIPLNVSSSPGESSSSGTKKMKK